MVLLQGQLKEVKTREQKSEVDYEKKLEFLNNQVKDYEKRVDNLQLRLDQYQRELEDKNNLTLQSQISFRESKQYDSQPLQHDSENETRFS